MVRLPDRGSHRRIVITLAIGRIVWESGAAIFTRLLDGVEPTVLAEVKHAVWHTPEVHEVTQVRVRWVGHWLHAELNIAVSPQLSVVQGHAIATAVRHQLLHHMPHLANAMIHVDPVEISGRSSIAWRHMSTATCRPMRISSRPNHKAVVFEPLTGQPTAGLNRDRTFSRQALP